MAVLLAHLLKWQHQPEQQGNSWRRTIKTQREEVAECLVETPSLKPDIENPKWWEKAWADALTLETRETGLPFDVFPEECPWTVVQVLNGNFWPAN